MILQWKVQLPVISIRDKIKRVADNLQAKISDGAMAVGVSVLGNVQDAYEAKSRHGTGSDGITWQDLSQKTLEARVRRRSPARKIVEERREIAAHIRAILYGQDAPRIRSGGRMLKKEDAVRQLRIRRADLGRKLDNLVIKEMSEYQIGIDTGLQANAAAPGFSDPHGVWKIQPSDSLGQNLFSVEVNLVTIGYQREYSAAFDAVRPIFPETLPAAWREEAEEAALNWAELVVRESLNP